MWQRIKTPEQVRADAGIGGNRAFGGTSSYDSRAISTFTPVALVKASINLTNASSSDCTKYFQRSIESFASFSGFQGALCAQAFAHSSRAGPVNAPAAIAAVPPLIKVRRVKLLIVVPPVVVLVAEAFPRRLVEKMNEPRIWLKPDLFARLELMALAENRDDVLTA